MTSIKSKLTYMFLALFLLIPFLAQTQYTYAIGIDGINIKQDGTISVDEKPKVSTSTSQSDLISKFNKILEKNKFLIGVFLGTATIMIGGYWVWGIVQFALEGSSSTKRKENIAGLIALGIATAMLGGATFFISFMTGLFNF